MVLSLMQIELRIPNNRSLKGKRMVIKSIKDRIRNRFNVSISEIDNQNVWKSAVLGIAFVGTDRKYADKVLNEIIRFIQTFPRIQLIDYCIETM